MIEYVECFDNNKTISFKIADYNFFKKICKNMGKSKQVVKWGRVSKLIILDSVIRVNRNYYPQTLLEECKYNIRKNKRSY